MVSAQDDGSPVRRILAHPRGGPTVLRIVLGSYLRRLRESRGITRGDAGDSIRGSAAKISRLELGRVGFKENDVHDLLTLYGVTNEREREEFAAAARQANRPGWWHEYNDVLPSWFEQMIGMEEAASVIRAYEVQFVPGLLQTPNYARAVTRLGHPFAADSEIERRVGLRMERQRFLSRPDEPGPRLWAVVDEAVLRRPLGGSEVMRAQLRHLMEAAEQPHINLQIAPFHIGGLAAAGGAVTILQFELAELPDVVYLEQLTSAVYLDKRAEVEGYLQAMNRLSSVSSPPEEAVEVLERILRESYSAPALGRARSVPRRVGAMRAASRDLAAVVEAQGGGDVHDVINTPFGVRLLIADVMGKGESAEQTADKVRSAFRELAPHEATLSGMAERMHAVLAHDAKTRENGEFVTALLVTIRDEHRVAEVVCCGHPPPLLIRGAEVTSVDMMPVCPPLGLLDLGDGWCESATVPFGEGDRLLLYTDGVTEARNAKGEFYPLGERVAELQHEDPSVLVDTLAEDLYRHVDGQLNDDAALLLVHCDRRHAREFGLPSRHSAAGRPGRQG